MIQILPKQKLKIDRLSKHEPYLVFKTKRCGEVEIMGLERFLSSGAAVLGSLDCTAKGRGLSGKNKKSAKS